MLTLVLTRHGHTERSDPEQYLGRRIDVPLDQLGRSAALALRQRLEGVSFQRVIASPLQRAVETARLARPGEAVETDSRIAEADYGEWEGHTIEQIEERWPDIRRRWEADPGSLAMPGGESGRDIALRAGSFIDDLIAWEAGLGAAADDHRVLVVAHSTLNRVLLCVCLDVRLRDFRRRFRQDWANLTVLRFGGEVRARALALVVNDVDHVRGDHGITWD